MPRAVVQPVDVTEVRRVLAFARRHSLPVTFRAAGTSLSGQAVTDGLLVELARHWKGITVEDGGSRVRVEPGVVGGRVNAVLRRHGRRMGPDPASVDTCMMGGILANNASGMCCGVHDNAYHTLASLTCVLADGTVLDTGAGDAAETLADARPEVATGLAGLRRRILADDALTARIRDKYRRKNTTGYSLNAFLDHAAPHRILERLLIGSEGTLAFIAEAVLHTLPHEPLRRTALLLFPDVHRACGAVTALADGGATAVELLDRASLRAVEDQDGAPPQLGDLPPRAAALLIEYRCADAAALDDARRASRRVTAAFDLLAPAGFTEEPAEQAALWRLRKGLYPSIGAARRRGTAVIIEDVCFRRRHLADAVLDLQALCADHGYPEAILFGHAKDGNLHFVLTQSFDDAAEVRRYERFMAALSELVVERYDGALKGEHGTGRNVAPFVESEWGGAALAVMRELKSLLDPDGILNPGVLLNDDPRCHVSDLKTLPVVEEEVDRCIECGFCEPLCPSRRLTTTPRQRIVVRREMARLRAAGDEAGVRQLERDAAYAVVDTCAADGLCATACPVGIDTGALVKRLRSARHGGAARRRAAWLARHLGAAEGGLRWTLRLAHAARHVVGDRGLTALTSLTRRLAPAPLPQWSAGIPRPAPARLPATRREAAEAVYLPSCLSRVMGRPRDGAPPLAEVVVELGRRAGAEVWLPADCRGTCCGMPFASKGYGEAARQARQRLEERLLEWSDGGRLPVIVDAASCVHHLRTTQGTVPVVDAVEWIHDTLLPRLDPTPVAESVVLHPTCATRRMGLEETLRAVAGRCAETAVVPSSLDCCATAGDRGLLHPELSASALAAETAEIRDGRYAAGYSTNLTCEIGLTAHTGLPFRSVLYLVERATRPRR